MSFRAWKIKTCLAPLTSCNCRISGNFVPMLSVFLKLDRSLHFTSTRMKNLRPNTSFIDPKANVSFKILLIFNTKFRFWSMHSKKKKAVMWWQAKSYSLSFVQAEIRSQGKSLCKPVMNVETIIPGRKFRIQRHEDAGTVRRPCWGIPLFCHNTKRR